MELVVGIGIRILLCHSVQLHNLEVTDLCMSIYRYTCIYVCVSFCLVLLTCYLGQMLRTMNFTSYLFNNMFLFQ